MVGNSSYKQLASRLEAPTSSILPAVNKRLGGAPKKLKQYTHTHTTTCVTGAMASLAGRNERGGRGGRHVAVPAGGSRRVGNQQLLLNWQLDQFRARRNTPRGTDPDRWYRLSRLPGGDPSTGQIILQWKGRPTKHPHRHKPTGSTRLGFLLCPTELLHLSAAVNHWTETGDQRAASW